MWYHTGSQQLFSSFHKAVTHPSTDCPDVALLLYSNRGNRCFNIARPLALEFGLLRMVRQPSADTHMIWVAWHKVTQPQTILKFRPPSSLDYRTRHGSLSWVQCKHWIISSRCNVIQHRYPTADQLSLRRGHPSKYWPSVPILLNFCTQQRGNRCFNIARSLSWNFVCCVWSGNPVRTLTWYE
jgi:hypothetical protein